MGEARRSPTPRWPDQLFDLATDPRETRNVLDEHARAPFVAELDRMLTDHFDRYAHPERHGLAVDRLPVPNSMVAWGDGTPRARATARQTPRTPMF